MTEQKPCVLACVTGQYDCDRIIETAKQIADSEDCTLRVLSVLEPTTDYVSVSDTIEYLYNVSKEADADMTVLFHPNAPLAAAQFAKKNGATRIVTGMHDGGSESFLVRFNRTAPRVAITMVAKNNTVYSMEVMKTASR